MAKTLLSDEEFTQIELLLWGPDDRTEDKARWEKERFQFKYIQYFVNL